MSSRRIALHREPESGFSLLEALLALSITLVVLALVAQTMKHANDVYRSQSDFAERSSAVLRALEDVSLELSRAGQGLGDDVPAVLAGTSGSERSASAISILSNPEGLSSRLGSDLEGPDEDVAAGGAEPFEAGALVLVANVRGRSERAEILRASPAGLGLRSLESESGAFEPPFESVDKSRVLGRREVRYYLEDTENAADKALVKDVLGVGRRILARDLGGLSFEFLSSDGAPIASAKAATSRELAAVRVHFQYRGSDRELEPRSVSTAITLRPRSGTVDFERRDIGFRLTRVFQPIHRPAGVASRIGAEWAAILAAGTSPSRDPAYLYTFDTEKSFQSASVDDVIWLEDVQSPVALAFGPESGPLAGSLIVAAWGLRIGHMARILPDVSGRFSAESKVVTFEGTEAIAQAGGIAFGVDGALYVTSREKGAMYRFRFQTSGTPGSPERLFKLSGTPGALAEARDGYLYFVMNSNDTGSLWRMAFDENLSPVAPVEVGPLPGLAVSLASDPLEGSLFALVRTRIGDFQVLELDRAWMRAGEELDDEDARPSPEPLFSLREWQMRLEEGKVESREVPFPLQELPRRMEALRTKELDFVAFDAQGSLYMGAAERDLVLKFDLDRPSGRYTVGVSATVIDGSDGASTVRVHAWKRPIAAR